MIGSTNNEDVVELSKDERYFKVIGPDITYVLDSMNMKVSIYRITVRAAISENGWSGGGVYSTENCVFGKNTVHINNFRSHVCLQCPWVGQNEISSLVRKYQEFREAQLSAAVRAL